MVDFYEWKLKGQSFHGPWRHLQDSGRTAAGLGKDTVVQRMLDQFSA